MRLSFVGTEDAYSELYVRRGSMPSRNQYDFAANQPFVSDQEIVLPVEQTGWAKCPYCGAEYTLRT